MRLEGKQREHRIRIPGDVAFYLIKKSILTVSPEQSIIYGGMACMRIKENANTFPCRHPQTERRIVNENHANT